MAFSEYVALDNLGGTAVLAVPHRCILTAARTINLTAADAYLQLFDKATAAEVTPGTTVPTWVVKADPDDPSVGDGLPSEGLVFVNGIVVISTTTGVGAAAAAQHVRLGIV